VVVCSRVTRLVERLIPNWVELHQDHESWLVVSVRGACSTLADMQLPGLFFIVDRSEASAV
jgi:hypothetical protein